MREIEESIDQLRRASDEMSRGMDLLTLAERMGGFGFLVWNLETDELWVSEGVYEVYGIRRKTALTKPKLLATSVHADDRDEVGEALAAAAAGGRFDMVHRVVRPDGDVRHVHAKAQRIEGDASHPAILLGTLVDVTPVDNAEA